MSKPKPRSNRNPAPKSGRARPSGRAGKSSIGPATITIFGLPIVLIIVVFFVINSRGSVPKDHPGSFDENSIRKAAQALLSEAKALDRTGRASGNPREHAKAAEEAIKKLDQALEKYNEIYKNHSSDGTTDGRLETGYEWVEKEMSDVGRLIYGIQKDKPQAR